MGIFNSNSDEAEGKWERTKGTFKDKAGEVTGDRDLEAEGEAQNVGGKAQEGWGKVKHGISDTLDSVSDSLKR